MLGENSDEMMWSVLGRSSPHDEYNKTRWLIHLAKMSEIWIHKKTFPMNTYMSRSDRNIPNWNHRFPYVDWHWNIFAFKRQHISFSNKKNLQTEFWSCARVYLCATHKFNSILWDSSPFRIRNVIRKQPHWNKNLFKSYV